METDKRIYSKKKAIKVGFGGTGKITEFKDYYEVVAVDEGHVKCQLLDMEGKATGFSEVIKSEELKEYVPCPEYSRSPCTSKGSMVEKHVRSGDQHFERREFFSAEYEYNKALSLDKDHLRANLGKGNTLFAQGEKEEGRKIFSKLSSLASLYEKQNKHIFNEFGIELRKQGMFDEAIGNYLKAIAIDPGDAVLYFNLARAHREQGQKEEAIKNLNMALQISPGFRDAQEFLQSLQAT